MKYALILLFVPFFSLAQGQVKVSNDTLHWRADRPLQWSDFKGQPQEGAAFEGRILCLNLGGFQRKSAHHYTVFETVAVFDRLNSWMPEKNRTESDLKYFQVMFDIYELHSRKMREAYALSRTAKDPDAEFKEKYSHSANDRSTDINMFRMQTKLGTDTVALEKWHEKILAQLNALEAYVK